MAKTKKPDDEAAASAGQPEMTELSPDTASLLDDTADMADLDDIDMPDEVERAMQEGLGGAPPDSRER